MLTRVTKDATRQPRMFRTCRCLFLFRFGRSDRFRAADGGFVKEAATSDSMRDICRKSRLAKIAQQKANAEEKKFAEQMIADHISLE